ncbi:MAG TPA: LEA type 2 family protein [Thermoanaerobaculia bacterium]|nr:LEA type 2 family protein [Thermoanaerobaculia bacterium]
MANRAQKVLTARRSAFSLAILASLLALAGCAGSGHLFARPKVQLAEASLTGLSREGADLVLDFDVTNPNRMRLPLGGVDYRVRVNGERFLAGSETNRVDIPARGAARVTVPVTIRYDDLGRILKTLPDHPRPVYEIEADFRFDVPVLGTVRVPVRERREIPLPELKLRLSAFLPHR